MRSSRWLTGLHVLAFFALAAAVTVLVNLRRDQDALTQAFAKAKTLGLGVDASYFENHVPDSQNGIVKFRALLGSVKPVRLELPTNNPLPQSKIEKNRAEVERIRPSLQPLQDNDQILFAPHNNPNSKLWELNDESGQLSQVSRCFAVSGFFAAQDDDWPKANREFLTAARYAGSFHLDPNPFSQFNEQRVNSGIRNLLAVLLVEKDGDPQVIQLIRNTRPVLKTPDLDHAIAGACAYSMTTMTRLRTGKATLKDVAPPHVLKGPLLPANYPSLQRSMLDYYIRAKEFFLAHKDDLETLNDYDFSKPLPRYSQFQEEQVVVWATTPGVPFFRSTLADLSENGLLMTAAAVYKYRNTHKELPKDLSALDPSTPIIDPATDDPFNYKLVDDGFFLGAQGADYHGSSNHKYTSLVNGLVFQTTDPTKLPLGVSP